MTNMKVKNVVINSAVIIGATCLVAATLRKIRIKKNSKILNRIIQKYQDNSENIENNISYSTLGICTIEDGKTKTKKIGEISA